MKSNRLQRLGGKHQTGMLTDLRGISGRAVGGTHGIHLAKIGGIKEIGVDLFHVSDSVLRGHVPDSHTNHLPIVSIEIAWIKTTKGNLTCEYYHSTISVSDSIDHSYDCGVLMFL